MDILTLDKFSSGLKLVNLKSRISEFFCFSMYFTANFLPNYLSFYLALVALVLYCCSIDNDVTDYKFVI